MLPAIGQVGVVGAGLDRGDRLGIGVAVMVERVRIGLRTHGVDSLGVGVPGVVGVGCAGVGAEGRRHLVSRAIAAGMSGSVRGQA